MCVDNSGYEVSLQTGKVYQVIAPAPNDWPNWWRVIDEEGEDYLYPAKRFERVELPRRAQRAVATSVPAP
jgi:hypothetical protein